MAEVTRTFMAIVVPDAQGEVLARWQVSLAPEISGCRWVSTRPFHATLAFLGDVRNRDLNEVCAAVASAVQAFPPFELELRGVGVFPSPARPRVIWAGLTAEVTAPVFALQVAVARALARAGYPPEDSKFHPHVTLGRIKSERRGGGERARAGTGDLTDVLARAHEWSAGMLRVCEVLTLASTLGPAGPTYTPLARARLEGKNAESARDCLT